MFSMLNLCYLVLALFLVKCFAKYTSGRNYSNLCLVGKTALVIGGSSGIGYEVVLHLASRGCRVIIANRSKVDIQRIIDQTANPNISCHYLDLSSLKHIRTFVNNFKNSEQSLDFLINNSGCAGFEEYTEDGLVKTMQVNYFGQFLLTHLLIDRLHNGRIVFVSSLLAFLHLITKADDINSLTKVKLFTAIFQYANSKVSQIIAAEIFGCKLQKYNISVVSLHPGVVDTPIYFKAIKTANNINDKIILAIMYAIIYIFGKIITEGADTVMHCILAKNISSSGFYCDNFSFWKPPISRNNKLCEEIWKESERLVKLAPEEKL